MKLEASTIARTDLKAGRYSDGRNLYLQVTPTGAKSWLFIYRAANGKQRELGLGSFTGAGAAFAVGLKAARLAADEVRLQLARGEDPVEARIAARLANANKVATATFRDMLLKTIAVQKQGWTPEADGTYAQETKWLRSLEQHAAKLMAKKVAAVTDQDVLDVLEPIWTEKAQTATRVLHRINKVMEYAISKGDFVGANPARYAGHIEVLIGKKASRKSATGGHKQLSYEDMPAFWPELIKGTGMGTKALAFIILTAVRSDEARLAKWSEIKDGVWTVPAERMKGRKNERREHRVPLSRQALELLASIPRQVGNDFIFAGQKKGQPVAEDAMRNRLTDKQSEGGLGLLGTATVHGFRKTFRNWAGDSKLVGFTEQDFEFCLAHVAAGVEGVYRDKTAEAKRGELMQLWADYATGTIVKSNVIQLAA